MEIVNKIQIRLDQISSTATTITVPFGMDFFPVDNTELQETEFIEKEKEKAVNPIFDNEKYAFYPTFISANGNDANAYTVEYVTNLTLEDLGFTYDDIFYNRDPFRKTYLRLNFYNSRDTKVQNLLSRETLHLKSRNDWYVNGQLIPLNQIPVSFVGEFQNVIYSSINGEGYQFYWHKSDLPFTLYIRPSIMNAKTGTVTRLYSCSFGSVTPPPSVPVIVESNGYNYIQCDFYSDLSKRQRFYYRLNSDGLSRTNTIEDLLFQTKNKITVNLIAY